MLLLAPVRSCAKTVMSHTSWAAYTYKVGLPPPLFTGRPLEAQRWELDSTSFVQFIPRSCTWSSPSWVQPLTHQGEQWGRPNVSGCRAPSPESAPLIAFLSRSAPLPPRIPAVCACVCTCVPACACVAHMHIWVSVHMSVCVHSCML